MKIKLENYNYDFFKALSFRDDIDKIELTSDTSIKIYYKDGTEKELSTNGERILEVENEFIIDVNDNIEKNFNELNEII